ncbi:MAG: hypothetical protein HYW85_04555, partial [Deltaproteobacteria bacterium]|nr:hypothetical protein [Deltaproteobacteria bacterium]
MRNLFYMGLLMMGTISSGFAGDKVGNGGFYLPKNDQGEPITVELGVSHPKNPELFDLIDQSRLPLELKEWLKDDLCSVAIYY